jgi:SAM-dependent methyltransferase
MWAPLFACPECGHPLGRGAPVICVCGHDFAWADGIHVFLTDARRRAAQTFARQYRRVRELDGHRRDLTELWAVLPHVPPDHAAAGEWRIRRESYEHLLATVLRQANRRVLDLGAGCGWLAARLAALGHDVVALDRWDDETDMAILRRHESAPFLCVQADFGALPFAPGQFDVVVFNASLHYTAGPVDALRSAARVLADGGTLVVMDSPMFACARDGEAMVSSQEATMAIACGLPQVVRPGVGYLTFDGLDRAAERLGRRTCFVPSRGPLAWRARRTLARLRLGRAPAAFGVWVAQ